MNTTPSRREIPELGGLLKLEGTGPKAPQPPFMKGDVPLAARKHGLSCAWYVMQPTH